MNNAKDSKTLYPLTHPQKRIWYIEKFYPDTSLYNLGGPSIIKGLVDFALLEEALNIFIKKNEGARLRIIEQNGEAMQYVSEYRRNKFDFFDFSSREDPEKEFKAWAIAEMEKPFSMIDHDLYYFALFKIDNSNTGAMVKFHHIIADGWSFNFMSEQVYGIYDKLWRGEDGPDALSGFPEYSYLDYLDNERSYMESERFIKNRDFWVEKFSDLPEPLFRDNSGNIAGRRATFYLEKDLSQKIKDFTTVNKYSLNTFFVTLYMIFLAKVTQREDIVIGTPVLNRSGKKERSIFGMFTSTMPCRYRINPQNTVAEMLAEINDALLKFYFNQRYPYDLLAQDIALKRKGYDNLFQVSVNYYNTRFDHTVNGFPVETTEFYNGKQLYAMQLVIKDWAHLENLIVEFDYKLSEYTENHINEMFNCLINLSEQITGDSLKTITELAVLPEYEKNRQIYEFNATASSYPGDKTIYQLFEGQAVKTPEKMAVCFEDHQLTYRELNQKSNQLARLLREKGVTRDTIVGLSVTHSMEAVIGILGIIKAGGAYLPIDPEYPADRIAYMLEDSGCKILLTNLPHYDKNGGREVVFLEDQALYTGEETNLPLVNKPEDMVYVIYTSGSTGKPKGVMIEHRGLTNYIWWARKMYVRDENDAFALYSSLSFDLTVTSVFTPLIGGNAIFVYRDDGPEYVLFKIMKEKKATIVKLTPSHLSLLKDMDNRGSSVRCFIVGGEDLKVSLAASIHDSFGGRIAIFNEYGPTETVVGCMIHLFNPLTDTGASVPIGIPAENVQIYILDKGLHPLPKGSIGEMYISGDGVARGYLNRPDLTRERFIENPFAVDTSQGTRPQRMYKTGDLAKFLDNGKIEYAGRSDQQVKIRGFRIELGEIERHLQNLDPISDAVVIDRQNANGDIYLCAYIVQTLHATSVQELRAHLLNQLPEYMIPSHFVVLNEIPLTSNGKVDRGRLPEPEGQKLKDAGEYIPPRNDKEEKLVGVISQVLNQTDISVKDNFFYLGGDSIKAIQIAGKLNEIGLKTRVRDLLSHPVIEEMAFCLEYGNVTASQNPCSGAFKPTPVMAWFLEQDFKNINHYNQSLLLDCKEEISTAELGLIMDELVRHHDSLRLNLNKVKKEMFYNEASLTKANAHMNVCEVTEYDLSGVPKDEQDREIRRLGLALKASLNIENGIPFKACIFKLGERGRKILFTAHHLVIDGVSWRIILEDYVNIFGQMRNTTSAPIVLPPKTHPVLEWARHLENHAQVLARDGEISFWNRVTENDFVFPVDFDTVEAANHTCITLTVGLAEDETRQLLFKANEAYGTRAEELMITALVLAACDFTKNNRAIIELEGHGREELFADVDISRTVGWFTSIYPVLLSNQGESPGEQIKAVKEQLRSIPHKGLGYGLLRYYTDLLNRNTPRRLRFNFLGDLDDTASQSLFEIAMEESGAESGNENHPTALVEINAAILHKRFKVDLTFGKDQFKEETMRGFLQNFMNHLKGIIDFCSSQDQSEYTPSDFDMVKLSEEDLGELLM